MSTVGSSELAKKKKDATFRKKEELPRRLPAFHCAATGACSSCSPPRQSWRLQQQRSSKQTRGKGRGLHWVPWSFFFFVIRLVSFSKLCIFVSFSGASKGDRPCRQLSANAERCRCRAPLLSCCRGENQRIKHGKKEMPVKHPDSGMDIQRTGTISTISSINIKERTNTLLDCFGPQSWFLIAFFKKEKQK